MMKDFQFKNFHIFIKCNTCCVCAARCHVSLCHLCSEHSAEVIEYISKMLLLFILNELVFMLPKEFDILA